MRRVHFYEVVSLGSLLLIAALAWETLPIVGSPLRHTTQFAVGLLTPFFVGLAVRSVVALVKRQRSYFDVIRSPGWLIESLRMIVFGALTITTYGWIKLVVPIKHPRLFDGELWEIDRMLFFGAAPTVFFLDLFDYDWFQLAIDRSYALVFYISTLVAFAYFLTHPSNRIRTAFANGNAALWIAGGWLYLLIPSIGPAFAFSEIWLTRADSLQLTQSMQALLMRNYQNVIRAASAEPVTHPIRIVFGIGAFPSLHVAFQTFAFLWMRRLWSWGEVLFAFFVLVIFLGSMITGWHYMIDGIAGMAMAWLAYRVFWRRARVERWMSCFKSREVRAKGER